MFCMGWKMDEADRKIIELLRQDARLPNAALGKKVNLSEPAARRRVAALVKRGVIRRFTVDVAEGGGVSAVAFITTSPHYPTEKLARRLENEEWVGAVLELSGEVDVAAILFATDIAALNSRIDQIRQLPGVEETSLSVVLRKWK
jgi:DNA-binding Lrp family transcriptional regulator